MSDTTPAPVVFRITGRPTEEPAMPRSLQRRDRSGAGGAPDPFLPSGYVRPIESVDVSETARDADGAVAQAVASPPGEVLALELADGTIIYTSPERLEETIRSMIPEAVNADGSIDLDRVSTRGADATRDVMGLAKRIFAKVTRLAVGGTADPIIDEARKKLASWIGDKAAANTQSLGVSWLGTKALMWAIESRLTRAPGLYRWVAAQGEPTDLLDAGSATLAADAAAGPMLVFIHGTASSTVGSYADLQTSSADYWRTFATRYGERIYAFEHRTMSESPIENALQLASTLPRNARLHIVTHSRGGLVGDLLCLDPTADGFDALLETYAVDDVAMGDVPDADRARLRTELESAYAEHRTRLRELAAMLRNKQFTVERYVRVASPARGTRLASGNLDVFLSGLLTLVGLVPVLAGQPIFAMFRRVVLEIAKNRTRPGLVPGIEAMLPESPMARLLARATPTARTQLAIIAGDIQGGGLLKRLGVLFTDHIFFNGGDNDLVVDTDSMYAGIARPGQARAIFDQGADVSHFRYFANLDTRRALARWLTEPTLDTVTEFQPIASTESDDTEAIRTASRSTRTGDVSTRPVVVVLPGIMGSHLWVRRSDRVWFDFPDLLLGGLRKIGYGEKSVEAERLFDAAYADLCRHLARTHEVEPYPYDWRLPLDQLADALAERLRHVLARTKAPVRLLAHSMGGLVVRALAHRHPDVWTAVMERDGARFIMLGTPNRGAHSMVETLIGKSDNIRKLALADTQHDMLEVLDIVAGFRGALQLLPSPTFADINRKTINYFEAAPWVTFRREVRDVWFGDGKVSVPDAAALREGQWLWQQDATNGSGIGAFASRITYVHGIAGNTTYGVVKQQDRWKMSGTRSGDGTVTWESGRIDGIGRYLWMPAEHGALADTPDYFGSLESLLLNDDPGRLATKEPVSRSAVTTPVIYDAGPPVFPSPQELELELIGKRRRESARPRQMPTITVAVRAGDLRDSDKPIVVGHYEQDAIAGAEALIDRDIVEGGLTARHNLGMYAGPVGTALVVLTPRNDVEKARGIYRGAVVTGLGTYDGTLSVESLTEAVRTAALRYLLHINDGMNSGEAGSQAGVPLAFLLLGYNSSATLSIADSVRSILRGVIEANLKFRNSFQSRLAIDTVELVELYVDTAISTAYALTREAAALNADPGLRYRINAATELVATDSMRQRLTDARTGSYWPRLHITDAERRDDVDAAADAQAVESPFSLQIPVLTLAQRLKFLYVGQRARAETVIRQSQPGLVDEMVRQQITVPSYDLDFSRTLFQLLVPNEFKDVARQLDQVVLVLDSYTANMPWELMVADEKPLAICTAVVRQLSTTRFRTGVRQTTERRAYVIGNPSAAGFAAAFPMPVQPGDVLSSPQTDPPSLPSAEREAQVVADVLSGRGFEVTRAIGTTERGVDVVKRLFKQPYRVLHIAAHGVFEQQHRDGRLRSGVVLSDGLLLTASEIGAMEVVPDLVFLNCCHLAQMGTSTTAFNRLAYSISRELIEMGVRAVVAAGWAVDDDAAATFAEVFYDEILASNTSFGDAVFTARKQVHEQYPSSVTWGAYQAYGDPTWRMEPRRDGSDHGPSDSNTMVAVEELMAWIEQQRGRVRKAGRPLTTAEARAYAEAAEAKLRGRPTAWRDRLDVVAELGAMYADLGPAHYSTAIEYYKRAVTGSDAPWRAPVFAIEQLANLEARHGEETGDITLIHDAISRLMQLGTLTAMRAPSTEAELLPEQINAERRGLLGSAWKRLAAVHAHNAIAAGAPDERTTAIDAMNRALERSRHWYGGAALLPDGGVPVSWTEPDFRNAINRLYLAALGPHGDGAAAIALARACTSASLMSGTLNATYWRAMIGADATLAEALLDGSLAGDTAAWVQRVTDRFRNARAGVRVAGMQFDSTARQLGFMTLFFEARAVALADGDDTRATLTAVANALRQVREDLVPGTTQAAPTDRDDDTPPKVARRRGTASGTSTSAVPTGGTRTSKRTARGKSVPSKAIVKKATMQKAPAKTSPTKSVTAKQATAKQATAKQATAKQATAKKATAKKATARTSARKASARQATAKKAAGKR